ncbi:MAG: Ku protein [Clostridiales bacterium]|nr:Ku protein [Clostridiales bacterium]
MAVAHKTTIAFSLVSIPISLYTAVQDNDISFNQLHKADNSRVRYKKVCGHCGKEMAAGDIVKGYEYDKDKYVTITDEDIENIKTPKEKAIQILHFAQLNQISPVYYDKSYQVIPEAGGEKAFELLRSALMAEQKIAIGKTVMGTKDTLLAIIPREEGMLIQTMFFEDEIKELPKTYTKPEVSEQEMAMATTLIASMDTPFAPDEYQDEYQKKLRALVADKIAGKEIVSPKNEPDNIINLMDALAASIEKNKKGESANTKRPPRKKKATA